MDAETDDKALAYSELWRAAARVAVNAYAPYSRFRVGAAVLGERGVYLGANVENACGGLGICAERSAIAAAIVAGEKRIVAIAVACIDALPEHGIDEMLPCGACRQWLEELAPNVQVIVDGSGKRFDLQDLMPNPYRLRHWGESLKDDEKACEEGGGNEETDKTS